MILEILIDTKTGVEKHYYEPNCSFKPEARGLIVNDKDGNMVAYYNLDAIIGARGVQK